jgi:GTP-binding protein EngB required for normal cell division
VKHSDDSLNSFQASRVLSGFKYVDQLLSEVESILFAPNSKSPFPKYRNDLTPAQVKVVQDYIARIRSRMVQALKSMGIAPPGPQLGATHSIRVTLEFAEITFEDCRPDALRGYGEVPAAVVPELSGVVNEMSSLVQKLNAYLAQGLGQDLQGRLDRLVRTTNEIGLLKTLEQVINNQGLIEFRSALSIILDKLESQSFQIAVFGRVSSGKSSLLNHILGADVLPVGVNPITAIPTRIVHGAKPRVKISYLDGKNEEAEIARLREFVSEQYNPGNSRHVTRITVELPSERLRDGVVFVDTPGLGSLATSGAAETLAYLPQCDLGVVLVDAGSTLTQEDLSTVQRLYEAAIPALVILSKADLLVAEDRDRSLNYISGQVTLQLGLKVPIQPVSIKNDYTELLDRWFLHEIQPLYAKHQELAQQSLRRKIGALRDAVEAALKVQLELSEKGVKKDKQRLRTAETQLRRAAGKFEEVNSLCLNGSDTVHHWGGVAIARAATAVVSQWFSGEAKPAGVGELVHRSLTGTASFGVNQIFEKIREFARILSLALTGSANALGIKDLPPEEELTGVIKEMPVFDPGPLEIVLQRDFLAALGRGLTERRVKKKLTAQIGPAVDQAFQGYGRMLELWIRRTMAELQRRFDSHADAYRAQLERLTNSQETGVEETEAVRRALAALASSRTKERV